MRSHRLAAALAIAAIAACRPSPPARPREGDALANRPRLPTGLNLDPAGNSFDLGSMPLGLAVAPGERYVVVLLNGWREQGLQVVDRATGRVVQTAPQDAAFIGVAFSPDGQTLYTSGGGQDVVYRYAWREGTAALRDSVVLERKTRGRQGRRYAAGIAVSRDGRTLYVAENLADSLAAVDVASGRVVQRFGTERYPYGVAVAPDGAVFVSAWGGRTVSVFRPGASGTLSEAGRISVSRHPSAILLNADGTRLFVASGSTDRVTVVDTRAGRVLTELLDPPQRAAAAVGPSEGSTPNALALSRDGKRLYVTEADNNAVAIFDLSAQTSGVAGATGNDRLAGRVPAGWYPSAVAALGDTLLVVNAKGRGTGPNVQYPQPGTGTHGTRPRMYTLGQTSGTLTIAPVARATGAELDALSERVARANGWRDVARGAAYPPFKHVIYIIKENRTYDQIFGDVRQGDGDESLVFFPRENTPNHHALVDRFGLFDRFFVNAEVSPDGHNWSMAAYATDYLEKTIPSQYSGTVIPSRAAERSRPYDYEGINRGRIPADEGVDDVGEPASGYLWNLAERKGITFRDYGEFVSPVRGSGRDTATRTYRGNKPFLDANHNPQYPGFDLNIPDQHRADVWIAELREFDRTGNMPALEIIRLPNDHTQGGTAGAPTPRAYVADNDLALGRMIEALSKTQFWKETVVFVLEDDAQNGPDHVDSHRSVLMVISPYTRAGVTHRFVNTTDVIATIEEILGLDALSKFDHYGHPLRDIWAAEPDLRPYAVLTPAVPLTDRNPTRGGRDALESARLDFSTEDAADEDTFNRILWRSIKGPSVPYPGATRMPALEWKRGR